MSLLQEQGMLLVVVHAKLGSTQLQQVIDKFTTALHKLDIQARSKTTF
jgi:hypothetical protein